MTESIETSSLIETSASTKESSTTDVPEKDVKPSTQKSYYTYFLTIIVLALILTLFYHAYSCFCANQVELNEGFIEKTIKTGTDSDLSFDVDDEVNKLARMQEQYLSRINQSNNK